MNRTIKKLTTAALGITILFGALGISSVTEASPRHHQPYMEAGDPPPEHHYRHDKWRDHDDRDDHDYHDQGHSQGEVNTAAIVGAVVGAVISHNT